MSNIPTPPSIQGNALPESYSAAPFLREDFFVTLELTILFAQAPSLQLYPLAQELV